ncbi:MAG: TRAP-type C4-dicarboxylate transport system periplasmic component [Spirochaetes bacterium]|nr:MAG: TRAP-type C4-dicarboxylate transport system periplasmic component [Spirochaetota bacterium]
MKKRLFISMVFILAVLSVFSQTQARGKAIKYKLPHTAAVGGHFDMIANKFVDSLSKLSNGRISGTVYPAEQLGKESQVIQSVQNGILEFTIIGHDPLAQFVPDTALLSLPFLFKDHNQAFTVLNSEVGETLNKELTKKKLLVLGWSNNGARVYTNNTRQLETPADFKGLKLRSPENRVNLAVTRSLGGIPVAISYGEVYTALQQRTIDGQENAVINIYPSKLQEVQKYMSMTNHILSFVVIVASEDFYRSLPDEDKKLVEMAAKEAQDWHRGYIDKLTNELIVKMKETGMQVYYPSNMKLFQDATKSVHSEYVGKTINKDLYEKTLRILGNN